MNKNILLILAFLIIPFSSSFSQKNDDLKHALGVHPFSMLWGGVKFDYSLKIEESQWIVFMPTIYLSPGINYAEYDYYDYYYDDERIRVTGSKGFGIELHYKCYLNQPWENFYLLGGLSNSFLRAKYSYYDYIFFYDEDELPFYRYGKTENVKNFNQLGASVSLGMNVPMFSGVYFDAYLGLGYIHAFYNKNNSHFVDDGFVYDLHYRGFYPALGFSLGYAW